MRIETQDMRPKPTTQRRYAYALVAAALSRVAAGESVLAIAADIEIPRSTVHNWVRREGKSRKSPPTRTHRSTLAGRRRATPAKKEAVLTDLAAGVPWKAITERHGVGPGTIYKWAKRSNRFLYGELAPLVGTHVASPEVDRWWVGTTIDDDTAAIAIAAVSSGATRPEVVKATGWSVDVADGFVRRGRALAGLPGFVPCVAIGTVDTHAETTIDWTREPRRRPGVVRAVVSDTSSGAGVSA